MRARATWHKEALIAPQHAFQPPLSRIVRSGSPKAYRIDVNSEEATSGRLLGVVSESAQGGFPDRDPRLPHNTLACLCT